jgi:DNA topoisomerase I
VGASERAVREQQLQAISVAAAHLGNTVAVCRRCYIHPLVLAAHEDGELLKLRPGRSSSAVQRDHASGVRLRPDERAVLRLLKSVPKPA